MKKIFAMLAACGLLLSAVSCDKDDEPAASLEKTCYLMTAEGENSVVLYLSQGVVYLTDPDEDGALTITGNFYMYPGGTYTLTAANATSGTCTMTLDDEDGKVEVIEYTYKDLTSKGAQLGYGGRFIELKNLAFTEYKDLTFTLVKE